MPSHFYSGSYASSGRISIQESEKYEKNETEDEEIEQIHGKRSSQESNLFQDVTS